MAQGVMGKGLGGLWRWRRPCERGRDNVLVCEGMMYFWEYFLDL